MIMLLEDKEQHSVFLSCTFLPGFGAHGKQSNDGSGVKVVCRYKKH